MLHFGVIDAIGICEIVKHFYEVGYKRGFIPYQLSLGAIKMLEREKLVSFGIEDEVRLQQLTKQWKENPTVAVDEDGVLIQTESEKPEELKELESQKELRYHLSLPSQDLNINPNEVREDEAWFCFIEESIPLA